MDKIQLNELLPDSFNRVTQIYNGSELLFAYELSKYSKRLLDKELVLLDVTIKESIKNSEYFSFVVDNGLNVGFEFERSTLVQIVDDRKFFTGSVEGVVFKKDSADEVVFDVHHDMEANKWLNNDYNRSAAYISLIAYLIVRGIRDSTTVPKIIVDHANYLPKRFEYIDLAILVWFGNKFLDSVIDIRYKEKEDPYGKVLQRMDAFADGRLRVHTLNIGWLAFVAENRQHGRMMEASSVREKHQYLMDNFQVGDVVLLYERINVKETDPGELISCYPAVLRGFGEDYVSLEYYPNTRSKFTQLTIAKSFNSLPPESRTIKDYEVSKATKYGGIRPVEEDTELYYETDNKFISKIENFSLVDFGVDSLTFTEDRFILKPSEFHESDGTNQYLASESEIGYFWLSTLDTIHLLFEEQGVVYNRERFLSMYYDKFNRKPYYSVKVLELKERK